MKFKDYRFVNLASEGVHNRQMKALNDFPKVEGQTDTYCTYFRYPIDMIEHYNEKHSVKGYQGKAWADWLPIDIDSDNLQQAQFGLQALVMNLEDYGIDVDTCRFYFSGAKGFHVMIPSGYFTQEPSHDIHKRFRRVAISLSNNLDIDTSIYDKTRIFRLPNTINSKTGLYKIELYPFEAMHSSIYEIKQKAKTPREKLEIETDYDLSEELTKIYHEDLSKPQGKTTKTKVKVCMQSLMQGVGEGNRDNVGVRVATHLRQSGLTPKMMWSALDEWNDSNDPPLETDELERIFDQGLQEYEFGCHDPILKEHCSPECLFYKSDWGRF